MRNLDRKNDQEKKNDCCNRIWMTSNCNSRKLYILSGIPWELTWHAADFIHNICYSNQKIYYTQLLTNLFLILSKRCSWRRKKLLLSEVYVQHRNQKYITINLNLTMPLSICRGVRLLCLFSVLGPIYATDPLFSDTLLRQRQVQTVLEHKPVREASCQNPIVIQVAVLSIYQRLPRLPAYRSNRNNTLRLWKHWQREQRTVQ